MPRSPIGIQGRIEEILKLKIECDVAMSRLKRKQGKLEEEIAMFDALINLLEML